MKAAKNPYKKGGPCYLAWEAGYTQALEDVEKLNQEETEQREDGEQE